MFPHPFVFLELSFSLETDYVVVAVVSARENDLTHLEATFKSTKYEGASEHDLLMSSITPRMEF